MGVPGSLVPSTMLGINKDGHKELLRIYMARSEGANFWLGVLTDLPEPWCGGIS